MYEIQKLNTDFINAVNGIDFQTLQNYIWANQNIVTLFLGCQSQNDFTNIIFVFDSEPTAQEKIEVDNAIAAHTGKPAAPSALDNEKSQAKKVIDDCAGEARARYITVAPGQSAVYIEKEKQSKAFKDAGYPVDETGFEFVSAEKNANSVTATVAADTVLGMAAGWKIIAATIEETRLSYKNQVAAAGDVNTVIALKNKARAVLDNY